MFFKTKKREKGKFELLSFLAHRVMPCWRGGEPSAPREGAPGVQFKSRGVAGGQRDKPPGGGGRGCFENT